jgi:hypothetical protein
MVVDAASAVWRSRTKRYKYTSAPANEIHEIRTPVHIICRARNSDP